MRDNFFSLLIRVTCIVFFVGELSSQNLSPEKQQQLDSLNVLLKEASHDTSIATAYLALSEILYVSNLDTMFVLSERAKEIADKNLRSRLNPDEKRSFQLILAMAYNNIGYVYMSKGEAIIAMDYYNKSLPLRKELGDKNGVAKVLNNLGLVFYRQGDISKSLEYFHRSLKIREQLGDKVGEAAALNNLGAIYKQQGDVEKALECFEGSYQIKQDLKDKKGMAVSLNNIGYIYKKEGNLEMALDYYNRSRLIQEEIGNIMGLSSTFNNLANVYKAQADLVSPEEFGQVWDSLMGMALKYFEKGLALKTEVGDKKGRARILNSIAGIYYDRHDLKRAKQLAEEGFEISKELGSPEHIRDAAMLLSAISKVQGEYRQGWKLYELHIKMRDSLKNSQTERAMVRQQTQYEFEKQQAVIDAEHALLLELSAEREQKQKVISFSAVSSLALVIGFLVFVYNRLKITRRQKLLIEQQKREVENQKKQVENQKKLVEHARDMLKEKNKEVMDSIIYAKRIQDALLKSEDYQSKHLPPHFIMFRPKDVVSGDFYWALEKVAKSSGNSKPTGGKSSSATTTVGSHYLYLAVADCTGHGVPGAFLTMLGTAFLNEITGQDEILTPACILEELRERIIKELSQTGGEGESKDGMDISLIRLCTDPIVEDGVKKYELQWAGANNPLYLIKKGELQEIKPDKQAIGFSYKMKPFTNHELILEQGDYLSLFTDGFADQFGGPLGKKYKHRTFKQKLKMIYDKPLQQQKLELEKEFQIWKGELEQVDDVCIIGVRI